MQMNSIINIGTRAIGRKEPVFIIAEAGVNHFGNIEIAKHLVDMAVIARADAVKFQIFKTENLISAVAPDWIDRLKSKELPYEAFTVLREYCSKKEITFLATAHDEESLDFLQTLDPPAYKIGSGEVANRAYIRKIACLGKPVIVSTGMYTRKDIQATLSIFSKSNNRDLVLLHCTTCYPPTPEEINLRAIGAIQKEFGCPVGYSDHSIGVDIVLAAVALGACVIEKHITVSKTMPGSQDCPVSCDERDLIEMVNSIRKLEKALGTGIKAPAARELQSRNWARKSVVAKVAIKKGTAITADMLTLKRPGTGIDPGMMRSVIGKKASRNIAADTLVSMDDLN